MFQSFAPPRRVLLLNRRVAVIGVLLNSVVCYKSVYRVAPYNRTPAKRRRVYNW